MPLAQRTQAPRQPGIKAHPGHGTGNILLGQFVGPFPKDFQAISSGFIPDFVSEPLAQLFGNGFVFGPSFRWTSMLIGIAGAALLIFTGARRWRNEKTHTIETEPFAKHVRSSTDCHALPAGPAARDLTGRGNVTTMGNEGNAVVADEVRNGGGGNRNE